VLCLVSLASAQSGFGECPKVPTQANFEPSKYLGVWYEITKLPFVTEAGGYCITANYTLKANGRINVDNRLHKGSVDGPLDQAIGEAYIADPKEPAKLSVSFGFVAAPYWVLATDYTSYAMVLSCTNFFGYRLEYAWILSRTPTIEPSLKAALLSKFKAATVDPAQFIDTVQEGCKYY